MKLTAFTSYYPNTLNHVQTNPKRSYPHLIKNIPLLKKLRPQNKDMECGAIEDKVILKNL